MIIVSVKFRVQFTITLIKGIKVIKENIASLDNEKKLYLAPNLLFGVSSSSTPGREMSLSSCLELNQKFRLLDWRSMEVIKV